MEKSTAPMATMNWHAMMNCWQKLLLPQLLTWDQSVSTNFLFVLIAFVPFFPFLPFFRSFLHSLPLHCSGLPPPIMHSHRSINISMACCKRTFCLWRRNIKMMLKIALNIEPAPSGNGIARTRES